MKNRKKEDVIRGKVINVGIYVKFSIFSETEETNIKTRFIIN